MRMTSVLAIAALFAAGCAGSLDPEVQRLEAQVQSLQQRVHHLEGSGGSAGTWDAAEGGSVSSEDEAPRRESSMRFSGAVGKLGRGLTNAVTGWVEIPKQIHETSQASGAWKGWTAGLFRGVCLGFVRTLGGCYETLTFPFPMPDDYQPLMEPVYVFSGD